jgi:hypothetical protein
LSNKRIHSWMRRRAAGRGLVADRVLRLPVRPACGGAGNSGRDHQPRSYPGRPPGHRHRVDAGCSRCSRCCATSSPDSSTDRGQPIPCGILRHPIPNLPVRGIVGSSPKNTGQADQKHTQGDSHEHHRPPHRRRSHPGHRPGHHRPGHRHRRHAATSTVNDGPSVSSTHTDSTQPWNPNTPGTRQFPNRHNKHYFHATDAATPESARVREPRCARV